MGARRVYCFLVLMKLVIARTICPTGCSCDDASRGATCADAGLDVVPIQLNPEAKYINLTNNAIYNVHFTLGFYTQLISLDISHNKIDNLGTKNFEFNSELAHLNISHNFIKKLEKNTFFGLKALVEINLSHNSIRDIHSMSFNEVAKLEILDLSNNKIASLHPETMNSLTNLKILFLQNNEMLDVPTDNLIHLQRLEILSLSSNLMQSVPKNAIPPLTKLKAIDLNNNILADIDRSAFDGLPSLRHLDLSDNNLTAIPIMSLSKLSNLSHLYLSGNSIQTISALSFQSLFHLKHLHISRLSWLERIDSRAFVDNINLEKIWMNDNVRMNELPARIFNGNHKLTHIYVQNNALVTIDASLFPLDQLHELQIAGNPFVCNCSMIWLWKLAKDYQLNGGNRINVSYNDYLSMDFEDIRCLMPKSLENTLLLDVPESEIRCPVGWVIVASIVLTVSVILCIVGGVIYFLGPLKRRNNEKTNIRSGVMLNSEVPKLGNSLVYTPRCNDVDSKRNVDRYLMIGTSISNNFEPWHTVEKPIFDNDLDDNIYQQFPYETVSTHRSPEITNVVYV